MSIGVFTEMSEQMHDFLIVPFSDKIDNAINLAQPIATTAFLLFITFYGYMILMGKVQAPAKEFLWRVCVIVLVLTVAFSQNLYERYVMAPTIHATTLVTKLTSEKSRQKSGWWVGNGTSVGGSKSALQENNDSYFAGLDIVFESVNIFTTGMMDALTKFKAHLPPKKDKEGNELPAPPSIGVAEMMMFGVIGTILTGAVLVYVTAGAVLLLNHIFLIILLVLGPMFVAMAAFKMTREYAKKWMVKTLTIALTLALVTGMLGFVLNMQGTFSGQLCRVTAEMKSQMEKNMESGGVTMTPEISNEMEGIRTKIISRLMDLHILAIDFDSPLSFGSPNQKLVEKIQSGCKEGMKDIKNSPDTNLLFVAMQYLVICMLFNRLITEAANIASALVGASGVNSGSQEVSGGLGGVAQRGGLKGKGAQGATQAPKL